MARTPDSADISASLGVLQVDLGSNFSDLDRSSLSLFKAPTVSFVTIFETRQLPRYFVLFNSDLRLQIGSPHTSFRSYDLETLIAPFAQ